MKLNAKGQTWDFNSSIIRGTSGSQNDGSNHGLHGWWENTRGFGLQIGSSFLVREYRQQ